MRNRNFKMGSMGVSSLTFLGAMLAFCGCSDTSATPVAAPVYHDGAHGNVPESAPSGSPGTAAPVASPSVSPSVNSVAVTIESGAASKTTDAFGANPLVVAVGTTVTWTNNDTVPHTVTSNTAGLFDSGALSQGQSFSHTFNEAGSFEYFCSIHPNMTGTVQVTGASPSASSSLE